ncbi:hypothetical protein Tco_0861666 [Tanacetum coccineum]|uniref:Uncharacterized protein n=1 Tax=Tanacetum coccineum TaxID=301880 RepID=A0ABQ5BMM0_9ASTR
MLAPSDGGLILYQAYGNLYAMTGRKAHLLEDKQIPSVGVFDEVFSTWMAFGGNTRDMGSFGEETDEITDLHQILKEVLLTKRGDGVASIKRRRRDLFSDGVWNLETASRHGRLKEDLESSTTWRLDSPEYLDTTNTGGKKETKAMVFHKMETEEISDRFVAPCFVNGLEAYDGERNLRVEENVISNDFSVKLCLDHEVKDGNKVVKKELIVALRGEIYFVKFIVNPKEDDVEPGVVFGRSFLRLTKEIADFRNETTTIYPELDPFLDSAEEEEKIGDD